MKNKFCISAIVTVFAAASVLAFSAFAYDSASAENYAKECGVKSCAVAYVDADGTTFYENDGDNAADMVFEAGSNGKLIAAYICLKLVDEGKIDLDAPVEKYLGEDWTKPDERYRDITVRQLLSHTAGFSPSFEFGVDKKIYFTPGSRFCYSGVGYIHLQSVIESVTGTDYETAAKQYVFSPLGMKNSTFADAKTVTPYVKASSLALYIVVIPILIAAVVFVVGFAAGLVTRFRFFRKSTLFLVSAALGYAADLAAVLIIIPRVLIPALVVGAVGIAAAVILGNKRRLCVGVLCGYAAVLAAVGFALPVCLPIGFRVLPTKPCAAYSLKTTAADMSLFAEELLGVYNSETDTVVKQMFVENVEIDEKNSWSLGMAIENDDGVLTYWHSGINPGMQSLFVLCPQSNKAVTVLTDSDNGLDFANKTAADFPGINGKWEIFRADLNNK